MNTELRVDRRFQHFRNEKLAFFAERVLRKLQHNPYLHVPAELLDPLETELYRFLSVLNNQALKRKARTEAIRTAELPLRHILSDLAGYVEKVAPCKSDINTTGFRPASEARK
jgi:hypothetical protein